MPRLTTLRTGLPVCPSHSPARTRRAKPAILRRTACTSGTTFFPSTSITASSGARSATCSAARPSVTLIFSPRSMASRRASRWQARARSSRRRSVSSVIRCLE